MISFFRLILCFASIFLFLPSGVIAGDHPTIRVAIIKDIPQIMIRPVRGVLLVGQEQMTSASIRAVNGGLRVNGVPFPGESILVEGKPGLFYIERSKFRGALRIQLLGASSLLVVNELDLEDYLAGLINSEISSNWPIEAVKAQAVAARTYALYQIAKSNKTNTNTLYDIESTVADQVYHGAHREDKRAYQGVRSTTGMVLTRDGIIFPAYYHSTCGGYTEAAHNVWRDAGGPPGVVDSNCRRSPHSEWYLTLRKTEFLAVLTAHGIIGSDRLITGISQTPFSDSPRTNEVVLYLDNGDHIAIKATELRRMLGYARLKSTWFNVGFEGDKVVFAGRGFGHGVGLCQWGAKGMAESGHTYREILKHYYANADIGRMY